jgi:hypothetical protein
VSWQAQTSMAAESCDQMKVVLIFWLGGWLAPATVEPFWSWMAINSKFCDFHIHPFHNFDFNWFFVNQAYFYNFEKCCFSLYSCLQYSIDLPLKNICMCQ